MQIPIYAMGHCDQQKTLRIRLKVCRPIISVQLKVNLDAAKKSIPHAIDQKIGSVTGPASRRAQTGRKPGPNSQLISSIRRMLFASHPSGRCRAIDRLFLPGVRLDCQGEAIPEVCKTLPLLRANACFRDSRDKSSLSATGKTMWIGMLDQRVRQLASVNQGCKEVMGKNSKRASSITPRTERLGQRNEMVSKLKSRPQFGIVIPKRNMISSQQKGPRYALDSYANQIGCCSEYTSIHSYVPNTLRMKRRQLEPLNKVCNRRFFDVTWVDKSVQTISVRQKPSSSVVIRPLMRVFRKSFNGRPTRVLYIITDCVLLRRMLVAVGLFTDPDYSAANVL
ncbi:hypothetical protein CLF_103664 [Clonorchis sinensis]|uniref:Uncharacterized protein n=1 Tax=Clonorchis sinensis TaxID=79923 RepID=G7YA53_CLOSI|nr:hypothetical protein CLF_103664 [Clonorchis sinensis]